MSLVASEWDILAKGGANAVFRYTGNGHWKGKLLRLRLASATYVSTETIVLYASQIRSHLPVVEMEQITLPLEFREEMAKQANINTKEPYGIIMPNLLPEGADEVIRVSKHVVLRKYKTGSVVEVKPKWLYSLPEGILTCRNCAISLLRTGERAPCPLDLLAKSTEGRWLENCGIPGYLREKLSEALGSIIPRLYELQSGIDMHSATRALSDCVSRQFLEQMALRDVTLLITLDESYDIQLVDIDIKSAAKWDRWKAMEVELMSSGLYTKALSPPCNRV